MNMAYASLNLIICWFVGLADYKVLCCRISLTILEAFLHCFLPSSDTLVKSNAITYILYPLYKTYFISLEACRIFSFSLL